MGKIGNGKYFIEFDVVDSFEITVDLLVFFSVLRTFATHFFYVCLFLIFKFFSFFKFIDFKNV